MTPLPEAGSLPAVLTVNELATLLRLDRKTVYGEIAAGRIPGIRRFGARRPVYRAHRDTVLTARGLIPKEDRQELATMVVCPRHVDGANT
ncbi:helix-turn-helix domain-containing protein [Polyangium sp. 15x6]|uniref:helix-turn-helix domain-containing protein n=1 Tax=Polyangium sp. 15x6 TaxID=3042687 RepID=UPI00249A5A3F|nr:helix-turn-helix domain-containing protein [Polyangium sp. 15x6]MDI3292168.1 helix-turn-helix domain-containing protein [Polyangium sp. 15x6]